jgi:hypothetical protein
MKIEIDTNKKTIVVLEEIKLDKLYEKCKEIKMEDYTIIPIMLDLSPDNHSLT